MWLIIKLIWKFVLAFWLSGMFVFKDILSQHKSLKEVSILLKYETIKLHKYLHECSIICFNPNSQETRDSFLYGTINICH